MPLGAYPTERRSSGGSSGWGSHDPLKGVAIIAVAGLVGLFGLLGLGVYGLLRLFLGI